MPLPLIPILAGALFAFAWGSSKKKGEGGSDAYVPAGYQPQQWQANPIVRGAEGEQVVRAEVVPTMLGVLEGATPVPLAADRVQLSMPGAGARAWAQAQAAAGRAVLIRTDPHATGELWAVAPSQVATAAADGAPWAVLLRPGAGGLAYPPAPLPPAAPLPSLPPIPGAPAGGVPGIDLVPEPQRTQLAGWLANPIVTPAQLRQLAFGFPANPALIGWLEARAKELEQAPAQQVSGHTYTLRKGAQDNASALAKHFTGDAGRWREILAVNPKMEPYTEEVLDASGNPLVVTKIRPWVAGQVIQLPSSWDLSKGPPPIIVSLPKAKPAAAAVPVPNASNMPPGEGDFDR